MPNASGTGEGRVTLWDPAKEYGFIAIGSEPGKGLKAYVGKKVLDGRRLVKGERVKISWKDQEHKTGRVMVTDISGHGVQNTPSEVGWVSAWDAQKGFGFIRAEDSSDVFIHVKDLGEQYLLKIGAKVFYDAIDKDHERGLDAINVMGPGVVLKSESLGHFFRDIGIEMDDELYETLEAESIQNTDDLLRCSYNDLTDLGFGNDAAVRIIDTAFRFKHFPAAKPCGARRNPLQRGEVRAKVVSWKPTLNWGMVCTKDNEKLYVGREIVKGGSLKIGETVIVTVVDSNHSSGRREVGSVRGYGYKPQGALAGEVIRWNENKLYGFIREPSTGIESYVTFADRPELALRVGAPVTYDRVDKGGTKPAAENVGGEGLCLAADLHNDTLGGAYGDYFRNASHFNKHNTQLSMPNVQERTGYGGKPRHHY